MDKRTIEWHEYKLEIYKKRGMLASVTCEELAIEGIKAREKLKTSQATG